MPIDISTLLANAGVPSSTPIDTSVPFWEDDDTIGDPALVYALNPWDTMFVGGVQMPGIVEIDALPAKKADIKKAAAQHGSSVTMHGYEPARVTVRVTIWTRAQWVVFLPIFAALWPRPGKDPPAAGTPQPVAGTSQTETPLKYGFDVGAPVLAAMGIKAVMVMSVTEKRQGRAGRVFTFNCLELLNPTPTHPARVTTSTHEPLAAELDPAQQNTPSSAKPGASYTPLNSSQTPPSGDSSVSGP